MKLHQLPIGARFEYQGRTYVKTGPMTAAGDSGGQILIPRYAVLKPLDPPPARAPQQSARHLSEDAVLAAFERFYQRASRVADEAGRLELAAARQEFLDNVGGKNGA